MTSRLTTKALENVRVELYLGEGTTTATCIATNNASWNFDPRTRVTIFTFRPYRIRQADGGGVDSPLGH